MADLPPPAPQFSDTQVSAVLTQTEVKVTSGFRGAKISIYGAVFDPEGRPSDVVVTLRGPDEPVRIARKVRIAGLWLNSRPVVFQGAPGYYHVASTRTLNEVGRFAALREYGLGIDHLAIAAPAERRVETRYGIRDMVVSSLGADYYEWRSAVVRLKANGGLYSSDDSGVKFVDPGLFRADISLPASAPTGKYQAQIVLFQDGRPVAIRERTLTVEKAGAERALYLFAHRRPWMYGIASVIIALSAGWLASRLFRRT
jgi:uncharacterized protein (TIGR02186 family)